VVFALAGFAAWQLAVVGFIFLGFAAFLILVFLGDNSQKAEGKESEVPKLTALGRSRLTALSETIYEELSAMHANRANPQARTTLFKETIFKEVVMIQCSYCRGLMPQISVFCPECGARRKG
jgi:hypothetical protein